MKRTVILFLICCFALNKCLAQSFKFYDVAMVGSLIDNGAVFPQESGLEFGALLRSGINLSEHNQFQIDGAYTRLKNGFDTYLLGLRYNFRKTKSLYYGSLGYIQLNPFKSYFGSLDYAYYANDLLTITTGLLYEVKNLNTNQYFFDFSFQIYFTDQLMLRSGVAFTGENLSRPLFEAIVGFEFLPKSFPISFYFELGNELILQNQFGFRYNFGRAMSLKKRHRSFNAGSRFL